MFGLRCCIVLCLTLACSGCGGDFMSYHFSYPPESEPENGDWTLHGAVNIYLPDTPQPQQRELRVTIVNTNKETVFDQEFVAVTAKPNVRIDWEVEDTVLIHLFDEGLSPAGDVGQIVLRKSDGVYRAHPSEGIRTR